MAYYPSKGKATAMLHRMAQRGRRTQHWGGGMPMHSPRQPHPKVPRSQASPTPRAPTAETRQSVSRDTHGRPCAMR